MKKNLSAVRTAAPLRNAFRMRMLAFTVSMAFSAHGMAASHTAEAGHDLTALSLEELLSVEVYSASKFPQKITEAPSSVTIITAADIRNYGYRTLAEMLNSVRGMNVAYDRNYAYLGVRGSGRTGDFNSRMLLLVDGYRLNDPVYDQASIGTEFPLDMDLIERVEVVRGPGSSIYGSNAVLGVINIITRRGSDLGGWEASGELASFNTDKERLSYGRRYENGAELLLSASRYRSHGQDMFFPEFTDTNNGIAQDMDGDAYRSVFGKLSQGGLTLTGNWSMRDKTVPTASYGADFNDPSLVVSDGSAFVDVAYHGEADVNWEVSGHVFRGRYTYEGIYPYSGVLSKDTAQGDWWGGEAKLLGRFEQHKVVAGVEYQDNFRQDQANYDLAPYTLYLDDKRSSTRKGVYVQDEVMLDESLRLNAGLRYDHYSTAGSTFNPRLGLIFGPYDSTVFKLLYGTAFRAPNTYELYYAVVGLQNAKLALKPEKISTWEFVAEHEIQANFRVTADVYRNRIGDNINQITDGGGELIFVNGGTVDAQGAEFEAERLWDGGTRLRASYAWQISRELETGAELVNSPRHLAKLNGSAPVWAGRLRAGLELQYTGSRQTLAGANAGGHAVTNLTLSSEKLAPGLTLSASLYNLFDKAYADPGGQEHTQDMIAQDGRSFRLKLSYRF